MIFDEFLEDLHAHFYVHLFVASQTTFKKHWFADFLPTDGPVTLKLSVVAWVL
jgi:hypothetical protein